MIDLLKLKEKSYAEYSKYELDNNEIKELREICYGYHSCLPLTEFFNDIERNRQENYNKKQAYKDLAYLVQYIQKLENDLEVLELLRQRIKPDAFGRLCYVPILEERGGVVQDLESEKIWRFIKNEK